MIFVTVGTHEQPFNRLIKKIDKLKENGILEEEVFIQIGFSDYKPLYCEYEKFLSYEKMMFLFKKADIVITHGGPSSFIIPLQLGKVPIVVPRKVMYGEHVNNHQVDFVKKISEKRKIIYPVYDIDNLGQTILDLEKSGEAKREVFKSHNDDFVKEFNKLIVKLLDN